MLRGEKPDVAKMIKDAKEHPWYLLGELFAVAMMIVGAFVFADWAYELGRQVGLSM